MTKQPKKVRTIDEFLNKNSLDNALVVAKNCYMNKITKWSTQENKLALIVISKIKTINNKGLICIVAKDIKEKLGIKNNYELRRLSKKMLENSYFEFEDGDGFKDGYLMYKQELSNTSGYLYIGIDSDYLQLFQNLSSNFTMIPLDALLSFSSKYSIILTQFINSSYDLRNLEEETLFGNREQMWGLFGLDDDQFLIKPKEVKDDSSNVEYFYTEDGKRIRNMGYKPPKESTKTYRWPDFESRVLVRAINEINAVSNILGYTVSFRKQIKKSDIGHYVDGYNIYIKKAVKSKNKNIIDIPQTNQIEHIELSEPTLIEEIKKQSKLLLKSTDPKYTVKIKTKVKEFKDIDYKEIEKNIIEYANNPVDPPKYYRECIYRYAKKDPKQITSKKIVPLPEYYERIKKVQEHGQEVATPEQIAEVNKMLKNAGNKSE